MPLDLGADDAAQRSEDRGFLGRGGMGEVRRVFDRRLNRELAMKILLADIQHPAIIPLHDFGRLPDGRPVLGTGL